MLLRLILSFFLFQAAYCEPTKTIYFYPGFWGMNLFEGEGPVIYYNQDATRKLYHFAKETGYDLRVADHNCWYLRDLSGKPTQDFDYIIAFDKWVPDSILSQYPKEKLILFIWEPPSIMPQDYDPDYHEHFGRVYTWLDGLVDNRKYFKIHYPVLYPMISDVVDFNEKKLCTTIGSYGNSYTANELYSERRRLVEFFEKHHSHDFDLYGANGWSSLNYTVYKGKVPGGPESKIDVMKNYRFAFAYENCKDVPGYITEKIFACFQAGTVPIYYGAPNITSYIPENCFISREDFASHEDLYAFLKTMEKEEYQEYIDNIQAFLKSDQAKVFSPDHFINTIMTLIKTPSSEIINKTTYAKISDALSNVQHHSADVNHLLVKSKLPESTRKDFLKNAAFWTKPIEATIIPIDIIPEYPFYPINPSICKTETGYDINCRLINYDHRNGMDYWPREGGSFINRNILLSTDKNFKTLSQQEIKDEALYKRYPMKGVKGQEDYRLFQFKGQNLFTCSITDASPLNVCQMGLGKISKDRTTCTELTPLLGPNPLKKEKNWLPFIHDNAIHAIYSYEPLIVYKIDPSTGACTIAFETDPPFNCSSFCGSAGPIPFEDGYLVLIHETNITDKREYFHRFIALDKSFQITKISPLFTFKSAGIEFACGMTLDHDEKNVIVSFGKEDKESYLAIIDLETIKNSLSIK